MTEKIKFYAFITQAATYGVPGWQRTTVMTASDDQMKERILQEAGCPDGEVLLVQPGEWHPPEFRSVDQQELMRNFSQVMMQVIDHLRKAGVSNIDQDKLIREGKVMPNPMSGRILFVYKINQ